MFDLLDPKFRGKLDDLSLKAKFERIVLKSSIPTENKVKLLDFLTVKKNSEKAKVLSSIFYDYFRNTKEVLEKSVEEGSIDDLKMLIQAELNPSVMECDDEQIDLLITLIMKEYIDRYCVDYPIWHEFVDHVGRNVIV